MISEHNTDDHKIITNNIIRHLSYLALSCNTKFSPVTIDCENHTQFPFTGSITCRKFGQSLYFLDDESGLFCTTNNIERLQGVPGAPKQLLNPKDLCYC